MFPNDTRPTDDRANTKKEPIHISFIFMVSQIKVSYLVAIAAAKKQHTLRGANKKLIIIICLREVLQVIFFSRVAASRCPPFHIFCHVRQMYKINSREILRCGRDRLARGHTNLYTHSTHAIYYLCVAAGCGIVTVAEARSTKRVRIRTR